MRFTMGFCLLALVFSLNPFTAYAATDYQPALGLLRMCDFLNERYAQAYSKVADFKGPPESLSLWQSRLKAEYTEYLAFIARMKKSNGYVAIQANYSTAEAETYLQTCLRSPQTWQQLAAAYPKVNGMREIIALNDSIGAKWSTQLKTEINRQQAAESQKARNATLEAMVPNLEELSIRSRYFATVAFGKLSIWPPSTTAAINFWKEKDVETPVSLQMYQQMSVGQELGRGVGWPGLSGESDQSHMALVAGKREVSYYFVRLRGSSVKAISKSEFDEITSTLMRMNIPVVTSSVGAQTQVFVNQPHEQIERVEPTKRYFATFAIPHGPLSSLLSKLENSRVGREFELELTEADFNGDAPSFASGWQTTNGILSKWLAGTSGQVIRQRVEIDPRYEKIILSSGRFFFKYKR